MLAICIICQSWDCSGCWNPSSWKSRTFYPTWSITMVSDVQAMQGAMASAAMGLAHLSQGPELTSRPPFTAIALTVTKEICLTFLSSTFHHNSFSRCILLTCSYGYGFCIIIAVPCNLVNNQGKQPLVYFTYPYAISKLSRLCMFIIIVKSCFNPCAIRILISHTFSINPWRHIGA